MSGGRFILGCVWGQVNEGGLRMRKCSCHILDCRGVNFLILE